VGVFRLVRRCQSKKYAFFLKKNNLFLDLVGESGIIAHMIVAKWE
jgi:hypothetical protein